MMCVGAVVTDFTCTSGTVCAGDTVECICSTSSGAIHWDITSNQVSDVEFTIHSYNPYVEDKGYTFIYYNESLNTSQLSFKLNHSETVHIECSNGNELDNRSITITDAGQNIDHLY